MMRKMNKLVLCLSFLLLPFAVKAQTTQGKFGYLSYNAIFQAYPLSTPTARMASFNK